MASASARRALGAFLASVVLATSACTGGGTLPTPVPGGSPAGGTPAATLPAPSPAVPGAAAPAATAPIAAQLPPGIADETSLGPPAWVQPGIRLTYYGAAASVAQSSYTYVEDPLGEWEDPATGKRYRRTDQGDDPEDMPTAAGEAFTQTDVLAVEGTDVVVSTTLYSIDLIARQYTLTPMGGSRRPGVVVDGAWVNPEALRQVLTTGYGDLMVLHGPYVLGGTTYDAISFVAQSSGAYQSSTYDLASGALLSTNSSTKGADSPVHGPFDNPQGNNQLSLTRLAGVRQRSLPGSGAPPPAWVATTPQLAYSGTYTQTNPADSSAGPWVYPMRSTIAFGEIGSTWAAFTSHTVIDVDGYEQPTDGGGVTGSTGLYWYDPATLASMSPGDVLDEDPVTGARISVESVAPGASGPLVTLTTAMDGVTVRAGYDGESGALLALEIAQAVTGSTIRLQLEN
jgi:hypothetical protein